jgi:Uncharacterised nucleotidyltransferase
MTESASPFLSAVRLARAVACGRMDERATAQLDATAAVVADWAVVPPVLVRHGLPVLALGRLARVRTLIPDIVWNTLETQARDARQRALAGAAELRRIARAFDVAGLPMLAIKGPALAWRAYGDVGVRPFTDLDLLVAPVVLPPALEVLRELEYRGDHHFSPRQDAWFRGVDGDYPLVHAGTGQVVELHARPLTRRLAEMASFETLWDRRLAMSLADQAIPVLGDDDAFLLQALHGAKHRWERLEWVAAVGELLRRRAGDIEALLTAVPAARRALLLACRVATEWVDAPLSSRVRAACVDDPDVAILAARAWRHVAAGDTDEGAAGTAGKLSFNYRAQEGIATRLRFAYRWACWPSPEDWEFLPLPDVLFFAYRVVRPLRLLSRYARSTVAGRGDRV